MHLTSNNCHTVGMFVPPTLKPKKIFNLINFIPESHDLSPKQMKIRNSNNSVDKVSMHKTEVQNIEIPI